MYTPETIIRGIRDDLMQELVKFQAEMQGKKGRLKFECLHGLKIFMILESTWQEIKSLPTSLEQT